MVKKSLYCTALLVFLSGTAFGQFGSDTIKTSRGDLVITFLGHASLIFGFSGRTLYVDPAGNLNPENLPAADVVFLTHEHGDHFDPDILTALLTDTTPVVANERCASRLKRAEVMKNGDVRTVAGVRVEAVPAYNYVHKNRNGEFFHPKGRDNGYIFTFGDTRVYVAGDTENHPEMKALKNIDIAFLPMNLPYTMTPEMVVDAVRGFKPKIVYLYHYRNGDTDRLKELMKSVDGVELRIRTMY